MENEYKTILSNNIRKKLKEFSKLADEKEISLTYLEEEITILLFDVQELIEFSVREKSKNEPKLKTYPIGG
jgi:hypothetical protein